jgi:sugar lactone lactonase YvrE
VIGRGIFPGMDPEIADVLTARARLGECPLWDPRRRRLAWVDIYNHWVHAFDPASDEDTRFDAGDVVSAIALADTDRLLLAVRDRLVHADLSTSMATGTLRPFVTVPLTSREARLNDGKCDAKGRFWIGSLSDEPGAAALYRCDADGRVVRMESGLTISNGLGWSPDGATFYLTDSPKRIIYAYDFDLEAGSLSRRRVLVDLGDEPVEPDGLAVDREGRLWSALWNGWAVACFDAGGRELERIRLPVQCPTSPTFGGDTLGDLYVTSASVGLSQKEIERGFQAGDLFRISTQTAGLPEHPFAA